MKYQNQLKRALEKFASACDEMAQLPLTHEMAQEHIEYAQKITLDRVRELKKQLEARPAKTSIELPKVSDKKDVEKEKPTDKKVDDKPADNKPSMGGGNDSSHMSRTNI